MTSQDHLTVRSTLARAAATLADAGVASPRTDAELLAAYALGVPRARLPLVDAFDPAQLARFCDLVATRARRVPLQHLLGSVPFGQIDVAVGPGVFIPRPETELLVAWALTVAASQVRIVVDFCSGTGAIALAVANARPAATTYAVENDPAALTWLRGNAATRAAAGDRAIEIVAGDVTDPATLEALDGRVDMLLCNPPYVPDGTPVPVEVSDHDPYPAVYGGPDGLSVIRPVIARAATLVRPGGWIGIEHDDSHDHAVADLFTASDRYGASGWYGDVMVHADLAGRPRFTTARRSG